MGQEDLIQTLFGVDLPEIDPGVNISVKEDNIRVQDGPVRLHLKVITTPGFGLKLDETGSHRQICEDVQERLLKHLHEESQLYRKKSTPDERVHLCLYILRP